MRPIKEDKLNNTKQSIPKSTVNWQCKRFSFYLFISKFDNYLKYLLRVISRRKRKANDFSKIKRS